MRRFVIFFCFLLAFLTLKPASVFAAQYFSTAFDVTYSVQEDGITHVKMIGSLTNTSQNYFASSYTIRLGFENIQSITASDPEGPIPITIEQTEDGHTIELPFNKQVAGLGKTLIFNLSFKTKDVAKKQGAIWEINIPGLSQANEFENFTTHVRVPSSFGSPSYIKPGVVTKSLDFTKKDLETSGISLAFGNTQTYEFTLSYHLKNSRIFPVKTEIAIPPTTNYQEVFIESISPAPSNVIQDNDGNWLSQYTLSPSEEKNITVKGKVATSLNPKKQALGQSEQKQYLLEKPYWQTNSELKKIAKDLKTPQAIYNYVVEKLHYDFSRVTNNSPRLGALEAFQKSNSAVCLEFTDLFIALARSAGIPAREVNGFANTQNTRQRPLSLVKDVLHAWPEFYDKDSQSWIMIDPTWGNTTGGVDYFNILDFDHVAFVIKGEDSEYPIPAGGYKLPGQEHAKDVSISFANIPSQRKENIQLQTHLPTYVIAGFPVKGSLVFKNTGNTISQSKALSITSSVLTPNKQSVTISQIPPYGTYSIPIAFEKTDILTNKTDVITIAINSQSFRYPIRIHSIFFSKWVFLGGGFIGGILIIIFISKLTR